MSIINKNPKDKLIKLIIEKVLQPYIDIQKNAEITIYRYNCASIRIRIVDPSLKKFPQKKREALLWGYIDKALPDDVKNDITMLLLMTPEEKDNALSLLNMEFESPSPSKL